MRRRQAANDDAEAANNNMNINNGVTILPNNISVKSAMAILHADNSIIDDEKDKEYNNYGCRRSRHRFKFHVRLICYVNVIGGVSEHGCVVLRACVSYYAV